MRVTIRQSEGFRRFLTAAEMHEAGRDSTAFGFCAKEGYCYSPHASDDKGNHGYPLDMPDYTVFYAVRGCGLGDTTAPGGDAVSAGNTDNGGAGAVGGSAASNSSIGAYSAGQGGKPAAGVDTTPGGNINSSAVVQGGSLLDITPIVVKRLGLSLP